MRLGMVSLWLLMCVTLAWAGTWQDDFEDGDYGGWTQLGNGRWYVENGELVFQAQQSPSALLIGQDNWQNYTIQARVKLVAHQRTNCCGEAPFLILRGNLSAGYFFLIGTWQLSPKQVYAFYTVPDNIWPRILKTVPFEWQLNTWYELKMVADGNKFVGYVDGQRLLEFEDSRYRAGRIGIGGAYNTLIAHFDDVIITGPDVPNGGPGTAVHPERKLAITWGQIREMR